MRQTDVDQEDALMTGDRIPVIVNQDSGKITQYSRRA